MYGLFYYHPGYKSIQAEELHDYLLDKQYLDSIFSSTQCN